MNKQLCYVTYTVPIFLFHNSMLYRADNTQAISGGTCYNSW